MLRVFFSILSLIFTVLLIIFLPLIIIVLFGWWLKFENRLHEREIYFDNEYGEGIGTAYYRENHVPFHKFVGSVWKR